MEFELSRHRFQWNYQTVLGNQAWNELHGHVEKLRLKHRLNPSQVGAVVTSTKRALTLIQGPPGTGKSTTAVAIVELHALITNLLGVCCPSNSAVDELMLRLMTQGISQTFLRVGQLKRITPALKRQLYVGSAYFTAAQTLLKM